MAYNSSWKRSFERLNIMTALGLMAFTVLSLTMLGITGDVVSLMETYKWLPLTGSLGAMVLIFLSSGTRDPSYYHPVELALVLIALVVMTGHAFLVQVQDLVAQYEPVSLIVMFVLMLLASAILAR